MRSILFLLLLLATGVTQATAQPPATNGNQSPRNATGADPHENPRLDGAAPPSPATVPDPKAVPNPVPVRPPNPNAPALRNHSTPAKPPNDTEIMRKLRQSLAADKATARYVRRVKVIPHAGTVTLKGTVDSAESRHAIEQKATEIAGAGKVTNELDIRPGSAGRANRK